MQPKVFLVMARASGAGRCLVLQRMYRCSYASVAIRLDEGVRHPPLMVVLYENTERGDPADWKRTPSPHGHGGQEDQGHGQSRLLHHLWGEGWRSP